MTAKFGRCTGATIEGRLRKAEQFMEAADIVHELADDERDVGDAYVTLCVHAGIAAADVVCCVVLGEHAQGDDHNQAVAHLSKVRPDGRELGGSLRTLLAMKTRAGYGHRQVTADQRRRAQRAADRLVRAARDRRSLGR